MVTLVPMMPFELQLILVHNTVKSMRMSSSNKLLPSGQDLSALMNSHIIINKVNVNGWCKSSSMVVHRGTYVVVSNSPSKML